ncbi:MAG: S9 family peptidase [Alphaproteobacteria bacterium]|nr:S9 family peptidase [Alphaproteobacteria bacterium]MBL7097449.1 S9 family peptidase [Alphaproteobacteria bacterium]
MRLRLFACAVLAAGVTAASAAIIDDDPYGWLSDIHGDKAIAWVRAQDAVSEKVLKSDPRYRQNYDTLLKSLDIKDRIPAVELDHGDAFNFWQDADHKRGIWRVTTVADYAKPQPHWNVLLDIDKLDADEHAQFVWQGADCAPKSTRCLVRLSPGGGDATTIREFDRKKKTFVKDGFALPLSKLNASYLDANTVLVATDFGPGTMTKSSYPRIVKLWKRGTPLSSAKTVFEGEVGDISSGARVFNGPYGTIALIVRGLTFFTSEYHYLLPDGTTMKLPLPPGADLRGVTNGNLIFTLRDDWTPPNGTEAFRQGSIIAFPVKPFVMMKMQPTFIQLWAPDAHSTADSVRAGRDAVYAAVFRDVTGSVHAFRPGANGAWSDTTLDLPKGGSIAIAATNAWGPEAQFTYESFLTPPTLYATDGKAAPKPIKHQAPRFDAATQTAEQFWVTSSDGEKVPYFLIRKKGTSGPVPTILYSYGGFELSLTPWYWDDGHRPLDAGQVWVAKGGAIAVANIRGGGEFGPRWHQAALRENRQKAFDDFAAVGRDLIARGVATPKQIGIVGASNGGVLTTVTMTQHPEMLGAVVVQRPLVDMLRYTHFGAGASWAEEYGDPDKPADRAWIAKYSAYQLVKPDAAYPPVLFITETSDDRVTPIWARMMAAKMIDQKHDVLFNESFEGGHGPGATNAAQAEMWALSYTFFQQKLGSAQ